MKEMAHRGDKLQSLLSTQLRLEREMCERMILLPEG